MEIVRPGVPEWRYQRQFDYGEGVKTAGHRRRILTDNEPKLLDDKQIRFFLANGYLTLTPELPDSYHKELFARFTDLAGADNDSNPGNNLLPVVPELSLVFDDPVVKGALTSILGPDYLMHPHRVLHDNPPGSDAQVWHHDSYWGYKRKVHNHRPWWVMIMYYPQPIWDEIGPTGIIPGSHCIAQRLENIEQLGVPAQGPAGTCVMIHYDIWHRKMKNLTNLKRFMVKFEFIRMQCPHGVTWDNESPLWKNPEAPPDGYSLEAMWRSHWDWLSGRHEMQTDKRETPDPEAILRLLDSSDSEKRLEAANAACRLGVLAENTTDRLVAHLADESEPVGIACAYALAAMGARAVPALIEAMLSNDGENVDDARCFIDQGEKSEIEMVARNAAHGLTAIGLPAEDALVQCVASGLPRVRKYACFALGEINSDSQQVLDALVQQSDVPDAAVRINAVEALGLKRATAGTVEALCKALSDEDDEVRFNAALALARLGSGARHAVPALTEALADGNRYVVGYAVEALKRIGSADALSAVIRFLSVARWCPATSSKSLF